LSPILFCPRANASVGVKPSKPGFHLNSAAAIAVGYQLSLPSFPDLMAPADKAYKIFVNPFWDLPHSTGAIQRIIDRALQVISPRLQYHRQPSPASEDKWC